MSKGERNELRVLVNERGRLAKSDVDARRANLLSEFETLMATEHKQNQPLWAELTREANETIARLDTELAQRCVDAGIPPDWRPSIQVGWSGRGENADAVRRSELRKVAVTRLDAMTRDAKIVIDRTVLEARTAIATDALTSAAGKRWLAAMPTVETLMQSLTIDDIAGELESENFAENERRASRHLAIEDLIAGV